MFIGQEKTENIDESEKPGSKDPWMMIMLVPSDLCLEAQEA